MGRKKVFESDAERARAYRERKRAAEPVVPPTEFEEQMVRDQFGYAASETRTQAERQAAADRIVAGGVGALDPHAFPAKPGDLVPSAEQLERLGL